MCCFLWALHWWVPSGILLVRPSALNGFAQEGFVSSNQGGLSVQRHSKAIEQSQSSGEGMLIDDPRSPVTPYSGGSRKQTTSPYQTPPTVTTSEQLQQYLVRPRILK